MEFRPLEENEFNLLKKFLFLAIYVPPGYDKPNPTIIYHQDLIKYYQDFGKIGDYSMACLDKGKVVGLAWCRQFSQDMKSYGYYSNDFLELNISVEETYRNKGIGKQLIEKIIQVCQMNEIKGLSLSVTRGNYAQKLYESLGFRLIEERQEDNLLILPLEKSNI